MSFLDVVKFFVEIVSSPLVLASCLLVAFLWFRRRRLRGIAAVCLFAGIAVAYLSALPLFGRALLAPLEGAYPPLATGSVPSAGFVVVLGSSYSPHDAIPVSAALDDAGRARIIEGIRLTKQLGTARLVVSGGRPRRTPAAIGYAELAHELGVERDEIAVLDTPLDTGDEAEAIAKLLGTQPFLLVTSAYHMPRAMRLMRRVGANPIPAPTHQRVDFSSTVSWLDLLPSSDGLRDTEDALHEYLGLAALSIGID
jgi:uncharacterized SAM-binding protein YcdF (DUF218 family)